MGGRVCEVISIGDPEKMVRADLGAHDIVVDNIDEVGEQAEIGIPTRNVDETAC